jgi:hypothetical protein
MTITYYAARFAQLALAVAIVAVEGLIFKIGAA